MLTTVTHSDGDFSITIPGSGAFKLNVSTSGFAPYQIASEALSLPDITLTVAAVSTEVQVPADSNKMAIEQVRAEEKQRTLGIVPNYYVTYNQETAPLRTRQKLDLARHRWHHRWGTTGQ